MAATQCQVCEQQPSKYRCPGCALRYCSVACCKAHKAAPCPGTGGGGGGGAGAAANGRKRGREDAARPPAAGWRQGRQQHHHAQRQQQQQDEDDDNDLPVLTAEMESALRESKWLQAALGDSTLRRLLADVDGGGGGGGDAAASALAGRDRAARLKEALEKYPDLLAFVDKMLMEVGALRYEDGRLVFTSAT